LDALLAEIALKVHVSDGALYVCDLLDREAGSEGDHRDVVPGQRRFFLEGSLASTGRVLEDLGNAAVRRDVYPLR
jgi:hypothetical protein